MRRLITALFWQSTMLVLPVMAMGTLTLLLHPKRPQIASEPEPIFPMVSLDDLAKNPDEWIFVAADSGVARPEGTAVVSMATERFDEDLGALLEVWSPGRPVVIGASSGLEQAARAIAIRLDQEAGVQPVYLLRMEAK
jgi:hypothetical protein